MADVIIRGVTYSGIDTVSIPADGGGTETFMQPSGAISITDNGVVDVTDYASAVVNVSGGGGGPTASDAILLVTVPAGSVVTMTKGADTRVPTMWVSAADPTLETALFVVESEDFDANPWTVTAVSGTSSASTTVVITSNKQFGLSLSYRVPAAYQAVEYIERPVQSGAYFNTGIVPARTDFVEVRFKVLSWAGFPWPLGLQMGSSSYWGCNYSSAGTFTVYFNSGQFQQIASGYTNTDNVVQWKDANTIRVSNDDGATFTDYSKTQSTNPTYPFLIFAVASNLVQKGANNMRVKEVTIGNATFVPCYRKSDSVPGFWNQRDEIFLTNAGADSVIVGPDL